MTGRRWRVVTDAATTWSEAFLVALSAGRITVWFDWLRDRQRAGGLWWSAPVTLGVVVAFGLYIVYSKTLCRHYLLKKTRKCNWESKLKSSSLTAKQRI